MKRSSQLSRVQQLLCLEENVTGAQQSARFTRSRGVRGKPLILASRRLAAPDLGVSKAADSSNSSSRHAGGAKSRICGGSLCCPSSFSSSLQQVRPASADSSWGEILLVRSSPAHHGRAPSLSQGLLSPGPQQGFCVYFAVVSHAEKSARRRLVLGWDSLPQECE